MSGHYDIVDWNSVELIDLDNVKLTEGGKPLFHGTALSACGEARYSYKFLEEQYAETEKE